MKKTAYRKDILRTISRGKKRFCSILIIVALGVVMFTGLRAACVDLRKSADTFMDEQNLYDIVVQSTLGLTDEDVEVLASLEGVSQAEGGFSETVYLAGNDSHARVQIKTISETGMNEPYLVDGTLPAASDEIAVTQGYLNDTGKSIGDTVTIEEIEDDDEDEGDDEDEASDAGDDEQAAETGDADGDDEQAADAGGNDEQAADAGDADGDEEQTSDAEDAQDDEDDADNADEDDDDSISVEVDIDTSSLEEDDTPTFPNTEFTITAVVTDPADINNPDSGTAFRISSSTDYTFFVTADAVDSDVYTAVYLTVDGAAELNCYSDAYNEKIAAVMDQIEAQIKEEREAARTADVISEAQDKIDDAEDTMNEAFADADTQIADAQEELSDAREELDDGWAEYYDGLDEIADGWEQIEEAEETLTSEEAGAREQIAEARAQLEESKTELEEGFDELEENEKTLAESREELDTAAEELTQTEEETTAQLKEARTQIEEARAQIEAAIEAASAAAAADGSSAGTTEDTSAFDTDESTADASEDTSASDTDETDTTADDGTDTASESSDTTSGSSDAASGEAAASDSTDTTSAASLEEQLAALEEQEAALDEQEAQALAEFAAAWAQIEENQAQLDAAAEELAAAREELEAAQEQLESGEAELDAQEAEAEEEFASAWARIAQNRQELADAEAELADGLAELEDAEAQYADGETTLADGIDTYETQRADAEAQLADAQDEVNDIDDAVWYVQDRSALSGFANIDSDSGAIEAIGNVFPILFLAVAILISLTTITRMVEEERGLMGTYKALGFSDGEVLRKYMIFSLSACIAGSIIGMLAGFIALPEIVFIIFKTMYSLPSFILTFDLLYGLLGPAIFLVGVVLATWLACRNELKMTPAILMRPKAPKAGSKVFLEKIPAIWQRLSFLNKVTARNLFRYKKRLFMTVAGILGCTALLMCGFAIKDTVSELMPKQYEQIYQYDLVAVADDNDDLLALMESSEEVEEYLNIRVDTVTLDYDGEQMSIQIYVVPDDQSQELADYITLTSISGSSVVPDDTGILVTRNAAKMLGFAAGDTVSLKDLTLSQADVTVSAVVENYLGNSVYMTQSVYESMFDDYEANGVLAMLTAACTDPVSWAKDLARQDGMTSATATQQLMDEFSTAFVLINMVVYIIIFLAAALAFVVLFTLSSTNISERERELATIKVLGFHNREVHLYVNKETLILTVLGILPGLVAGYFLGHAMTAVLNMPSLYFAVSIYPVSYFISGGLMVLFALLVQLVTNRTLDHIDPVEALKSIE